MTTSSDAGAHTPTPAVTLRDVVDGDLQAFFVHQLEPEANRMAAFAAKDPTDRDAFMAHWTRIRHDESVRIQTILYREEVAGHIAYFLQFERPSVSYWIGREHWGKGIATEALRQFLTQITLRPLYARVAKDNTGSIRVLEKCGFAVWSEDGGFSHVRNEDVEEFIMELKG